MHRNNNPWLVTSVTDLSYFCCPECQYRSKNLDYFRIHALNNHERANDLFNREELSLRQEITRTTWFKFESQLKSTF